MGKQFSYLDPGRASVWLTPYMNSRAVSTLVPLRSMWTGVSRWTLGCQLGWRTCCIGGCHRCPPFFVETFFFFLSLFSLFFFQNRVLSSKFRPSINLTPRVPLFSYFYVNRYPKVSSSFILKCIVGFAVI
jgi:hypothetical protein